MRAPHFWSAGLDPKSRESAPLTRLILTPFAALYAGITTRRIASASPYKTSTPVICIGNLTSGGSGKTPIVQAIRKRLLAQNVKAATLSRGYGGKLKGPLKVHPEHHSAADVGDEPLMLSVDGESWISRDRKAGGIAIDTTSDAALIIMDDGHQNPSLFKNLSLIVIDSEVPFGNGHILPKGPLRESPQNGLARADAVILMGDRPVPAAVSATGLPVLRAHLKQTAQLPPGPIFAFAGIGHPSRFFDSLRAAGADVLDTLSYPDHYKYSRQCIEKLTLISKTHDCALVTTRKDYVRISESDRVSITPIDVAAEFEDWTALDALLSSLLTEREK